EVMADAGLTDIFLPYNILGRQKLERLLALHRRVTISVTADSSTTIDGLAETFRDAGHPLKVLVECDTGGGRGGEQDAQEDLPLAHSIDVEQCRSYGGLITITAEGTAAEAEVCHESAQNLLSASGLASDTITSGDTPDMWRTPQGNIVT